MRLASEPKVSTSTDRDCLWLACLVDFVIMGAKSLGHGGMGGGDGGDVGGVRGGWG